ncbi:hypothetical protein [Megalodesulfovibrio paquesii]
MRGILIGGSLGVFAALLGFVDMGRGAAWGMLGGFFAGLTLARRARKREEAASLARKQRDAESDEDPTA